MKTPSELSNRRIGVVGSGAIGCYYGARLAYFGRDVHFLMRGDLGEIRRSGLRIKGKEEDFRVEKVNCHASSEEIGPCDLVLVAVKTTSNADLIRLIPPLLHQNTMLLTLQNGLGNEEFLAERFGAERVLGGLCFVCLNRVSRGVIEQYDQGHVALGEYNRGPQARTHDLAREFERCGVVCSVVENLALERWRKLIWNIPFNGLSVAAGGLDTAAILSDDHLRGVAVGLMDEVVSGADKCGFQLPAAAAQEQVKRTESMGAYQPSTLIDFQAGRPLEIEAIWGEPLRRAVASGAQMPRLEVLYALLKSLAHKAEIPGAANA
jgi:2-dehydropantoate 2-reductase